MDAGIFDEVSGRCVWTSVVLVCRWRAFFVCGLWRAVFLLRSFELWCIDCTQEWFGRPWDSCVFVQVVGSGCTESQQAGLNKDLTVGPVRFFAYVLN